MSDLRASLEQIEADLDQGTYRPGPWAAWLRRARALPQPERMSIAADVSRVSDKLHLRQARRKISYASGLGLEIVATIAGVWLLATGLRETSATPVLIGALLLTMTMQPLVKISVGTVLGIRYSYAYLWGAEPRFKMRYGTYLAASRWKRVLLHLAGTVGSVLALAVAHSLAEPELPSTATILRVLLWIVVALQVLPFLAGIAGLRRLGPLGPPTNTSGGAAGVELRDAWK